MPERKDQFARIEERWRERLADYLVQGHLRADRASYFFTGEDRATE
jgi:hypothetical protein